MPGFNICGTGDGPAATLETRRKHRWVFETLGRGNGQFSEAELLVLKSAQRPNFKFEEPEMHHNQEVARFAGKQDWEPITMTWYDVEQDPDVSSGIYAWLETVVNFASANVNPPAAYKRQAELAMVDGSGQTTEGWQICNTWPKEVNWGDIDYSDTEIATIEASMRFDRAIKSCVAAPGPNIFGPSCGFQF
jgi:hypothetical protein